MPVAYLSSQGFCSFSPGKTKAFAAAPESGFAAFEGRSAVNRSQGSVRSHCPQSRDLGWDGATRQQASGTVGSQLQIGVELPGLTLMSLK